MALKNVTIYTDGACSKNPGPGGYGAVLIYKDTEKVISGAQENTTNNRMELMAAIEALRLLKEPCNVDLYTDSAYLCRAFNDKWLAKWVENGWKNSSKKDVENRDLWEILLKLSNEHSLTWHKVKGHSDNELNNRCDELARNAIKSL